MAPNIIVFDTETTGIDPSTDRLVELAGVSHGREEEIEFTTLVNPMRSIPPEVRAIHHITPADVVGAPSEEEAWRMFLDSFPDTVGSKPEPIVLVAHNAKFDAGFVSRIAPAFECYYVDTLKCAYVTFVDSPSFGNQVLRYYLELEIDVPPTLFPHRALYDCIVTRGIFRELLKHHSLRELVQISSGPVLLPRVFFGKHKGKTWDQVDYGYLKWCQGNMKDDENVQHTVAHHMRRK